MHNASIVVATYNRADLLEKTLKALLKQDFPNEYEIIVVDDGSIDKTAKIVKKYPVKLLTQKHKGPAAARNLGIKESRFPVVVVMDDDCVPEKDWLKKLVSGFSGNVGITSSFSIYGGTSTAYLKKVVEKVGYFDETFPFEYREDTDLVFRILDEGYEVKFIPPAKFTHLHKTPDSIHGKIRYVLKRVRLHQVDPLLYKKHPRRTKEFLDVRFGFIRNPIRDFQVATGTWGRKSKFKLSSPQGITFIENKTPIHGLLIFIGGVAYVFAVKLTRLYGSIKYRKLLI